MWLYTARMPGTSWPIRSAWSARCGGASTTRGPVEAQPAAVVPLDDGASRVV
jgi:hypothetical protein